MVKGFVANRIKREAMSLTQTDFAKLVGTSSATISTYENGYEISESTVKCIRYTIKDLESKMTEEELGPYKLRVACEMAIAEPDDEMRKEKLRSVMFSALTWQDKIDKKKRGF